MSNEKTLNSILKSLKAINARLGTVATASLSADVAAATADLATEITNEEAVNTVIDLCRTAVGTPAGTDSIAEQSVALWAVLEGT